MEMRDVQGVFKKKKVLKLKGTEKYFVPLEQTMERFCD